jgi:hypothetical protein
MWTNQTIGKCISWPCDVVGAYGRSGGKPVSATLYQIKGHTTKITRSASSDMLPTYH